MSYQALYRAWRPQTFADIIGQPHVKQTLQNAIARDRVAHAYLFCGPRGTGKTSAAKVLAKAVNCQNPDGTEPCNHCEACISITNGGNVDVEEIDAASNRGVDEIRQLRDKVQYAPASVKKKVYIVDEVHMLTTEAFNALLKTLEEPPSHTLFVLATTEPHKIPPTIISRCQRFDFRRHEPESIVEHLRHICADKQWTYDEEALWRVAEAADGGLRDALGLLEQTAAYARGHLTAEDAAHVMGGVQTTELLQLIEDILASDAASVMRRLMTWYAGGKDAARIVHEVLQLVRDLFIVKLCEDTPSERFSESFLRVASVAPEEWLLGAMKKLGETYVQLRYVDMPRLALETALLGIIPTESGHGGETTVASSTGFAQKGAPRAVDASTTVQSGMPATVASAVPAGAASADPGAAATPAGAASASANTADAAASAGVDLANHVPAAPGAAERKVSAERNAPAAAASPSRAPKRAPAGGRGSASRKTEVLKQLWAARDDGLLQRMEGGWDGILAQVKAERITTHAWLMNGSPVLATPGTVVLAFSSRIHRDAVMKPEERPVIEQVMSGLFEMPIQVLALLQADWDSFVQSLEAVPADESKAELSKEAPTDELVNRVVQLFGRDRVEIRHEE